MLLQAVGTRTLTSQFLSKTMSSEERESDLAHSRVYAALSTALRIAGGSSICAK
jgi:hypothetical protein